MEMCKQRAKGKGRRILFGFGCWRGRGGELKRPPNRQRNSWALRECVCSLELELFLELVCGGRGETGFGSLGCGRRLGGCPYLGFIYLSMVEA